MSQATHNMPNQAKHTWLGRAPDRTTSHPQSPSKLSRTVLPNPHQPTHSSHSYGPCQEQVSPNIARITPNIMPNIMPRSRISSPPPPAACAPAPQSALRLLNPPAIRTSPSYSRSPTAARAARSSSPAVFRNDHFSKASQQPSCVDCLTALPLAYPPSAPMLPPASTPDTCGTPLTKSSANSTDAPSSAHAGGSADALSSVAEFAGYVVSTSSVHAPTSAHVAEAAGGGGLDGRGEATFGDVHALLDALVPPSLSAPRSLSPHRTSSPSGRKMRALGSGPASVDGTGLSTGLSSPGSIEDDPASPDARVTAACERVLALLTAGSCLPVAQARCLLELPSDCSAALYLAELTLPGPGARKASVGREGRRDPPTHSLAGDDSDVCTLQECLVAGVWSKAQMRVLRLRAWSSVLAGRCVSHCCS